MIATAMLLVGSLLAVQDLAPANSDYATHGYCFFGGTVGRAGDVNLDGVPDFVLGDNGFPGEFPPTFWIVSGKDGSTLQVFSIPEAASCYRLADGGSDADGDGVPDLVIESFDFDRSETSVYLVSGKTGTLPRRITSQRRYHDPPYGAHFVGDCDHDGLADTGVLRHSGNESSGALQVYSGRSGQLVASFALRAQEHSGWRSLIELPSIGTGGAGSLALLTTTSLELHVLACPTSNDPWTLVWSDSSSARAGRTPSGLIALRDLDGDAVEDVAASFCDAVEIVSGRTGRRLFHLESKVKGDSETGFGRALARLGDVDGDGLDDLAISETESGACCGSVHAYSGKDGQELWETRTLGDDALHHFGSEMDAIGDIDGDRVTDLVVGTYAVFRKVPGVACVISGKTGAELYRFRRAGDTALEVSRRFPVHTTPR